MVASPPRPDISDTSDLTIVVDPKFIKVGVPDEAAFANKKWLAGDAGDFYDIQKRVDFLIKTKHTAKLSFLEAYDITVHWVARGSKRGGKSACGKCSKIGGKVERFTDAHFLIEVSADICRAIEISEHQMDALLTHELCHCGQAENTLKPKVVAHDVEEFMFVIEEYGFWQADLQAAMPSLEQAVQQARLL